MKPKPLPPMLRLALERLRDFRRPAAWHEFALLPAGPQGRRSVNVFRWLKARGFIRDVTPPYKEGDIVPRYSRYVLTPDGERALEGA